MSLLEARHILLCLRYGIGDLIMELPALEALRAAVPAARITAIGARPALELLEGDRLLDALIAVQDFGLTHWGDFGTPEIQSDIRDWLGRENFDTVLDPSHAAMGLGQAIWDFRPPIFDSGAEAQVRTLQLGAGGAAAVRAGIDAGWGLTIRDTSGPVVHLQPKDRMFADRYLDGNGIASTPIGVSMVASSALKRWSVARFADMVDRLAEETGAPIMLFCGPQEELGAALRASLRHRRRVLPVGALHLRRVAALLGACRLFIGHDTGLMHLAAALGVPLVALFGPTSPDIYLPDQVAGIGLGGRDYCPWRLTEAFGPPQCVMQGRCLAGIRSCIDQVFPEDVMGAIALLLVASGKMPPKAALQGEPYLAGNPEGLP